MGPPSGIDRPFRTGTCPDQRRIGQSTTPTMTPSGFSERMKRSCLAAVCVAVLFAGFLSNAWGVADAEWFEGFQRDTEALVVGNLVKSRQDGLLSAAGFNGAGLAHLRNYPRDAEQVERQYAAYLEQARFDRFTPYLSQHGGQGLAFSVLDSLLPLSPDAKLELFHAITAFLSAAVLGALVVWFHAEFGGWVAVCVALSMVASQWLTVFGRNLWWSLWAFYLPMLSVTFYLQGNTERTGSSPTATRLGALVFAAVLVKCFVNGYEYMTATVVMLLVPLLYYAVRDGWSLRRKLKSAGSAVVASGAAILASLAALCAQIGALKGDLADGVSYVAFTFGKRTHGGLVGDLPDRFSAGLDADLGSVIGTYLKGAYFDLENYFPSSSPIAELLVFAVEYWQLVIVFAVASVALAVRRAGSRNTRKSRHSALVWATWFSVLAPLSWFVVFKAHSHVHTHMNFILWQMPFTFFGFAVCAAAVEDALPSGAGSSPRP